MFEILSNIDNYLLSVIEFFGIWTYLILFIIVFAETGIVIAPFLPSDSLIFSAGALASGNHLQILIVYAVSLFATITGDSTNYFLGHKLGKRAFENSNSKIFKQEYLERSREYYERYGPKVIMFSRFFPLMRTFIPFVAGVGDIPYRVFVFYNAIGNLLWVSLYVFLGYFFGSLPFFQDHFEYLVFVLLGFALIPMSIEFVRYRKPKPLSQEQQQHANYQDTYSSVHKPR